MKFYGIFRGFPGLGRVMSGVSILAMLKKEGHDVKAYSYMQGLKPIEQNGFEMIIPDVVDRQEISSMGLSPIGRTGAKIIETICNDKPDLVIIDGEPLFISTLAMVYPRNRILALLNPSDIYNPSLPKSTIDFFHTHYLSAGAVVVHGVNPDSFVLPTNRRECKIFTANTILRQEVIDVENNNHMRIVSILGGGCSNASDSFYASTIEMGKKIIDAAGLMPNEKFSIYCNDKNIAEQLLSNCSVNNVEIVENYTSPKEMYMDAKAVICRAGRNTISEILYLNIPAILMSTNGDFRSVEQEKNIDQVCNLRPGRLVKSNNYESGKELMQKIHSVIAAEDNGYEFKPGNDFVLRVIDGMI